MGNIGRGIQAGGFVGALQGHEEVFLVVLVVLGEFDEGGRAIGIGRGGEVGPDGESLGVAVEFFLDEAAFPEGMEHEGVAGGGRDGTAVEFTGFFEPALGGEPAGEAAEFSAVGEVAGEGVFKNGGDDRGEEGEREDVEGVVLENGFEFGGAAGAEEFEIELRDELAGDITGAFMAEDVAFELDEAAALEAKLPEAAGAIEKIEVLEMGKGSALAGEGVAGFKQGLVVGAAVEGDEGIEFGQKAGEAAEGAWFFTVFADEPLAE